MLKRFSSFFSIKKFYLEKKTLICDWDYFLCVKDLLLVVFTAATVELCGGSLVGLSRCRIVDLGLCIVGALVLISWSSSGAVICWVSFPNQSFFFLLVYVYKFKIISRMKMNLNFSFCFWLLYNGVWRPFLFVCVKCFFSNLNFSKLGSSEITS